MLKKEETEISQYNRPTKLTYQNKDITILFYNKYSKYDISPSSLKSLLRQKTLNFKTQKQVLTIRIIDEFKNQLRNNLKIVWNNFDFKAESLNFNA